MKVSIAASGVLLAMISHALPLQSAPLGNAYVEAAPPPSIDATAVGSLPNDAPASTRDRANAPEPAPRSGARTRVGVLGAAGFPRPIGVEAAVKIGQVLLLGAEYSALPTVNVAGANFEMHAYAADVRVFPFKSPFFFGMRAGYQYVKGSATVDLGSYGTYAGSYAVESFFVNPRLGFLWTFGPGISIGMNAGLQLPLSPKVSSQIPSAAASSSTVAGATNVATMMGAKVTPTVDVLQLGWMF